ncbi:xanthine dehydrogenase family protein molybdopterin-binding subunit [Janthinobacterium agaricidamnosum]|uniref:Tat (Twin-arginine translocation) pathway signal sequence domain protein n=1 Tax=Janthinobacterium agaricidamnosum NBRC 102515 = DSM 9628 TaxID=1349767 RepID=W0V2M9_9BURK|nr:molybdopterin cofactor-binding domain-containing protein [Janthinobacterium agaricidamnosum]CDG82136.1 tat (twin-arginine translocation) pathway signal sequence domain protein [Janthinobacterium agaricidamnosum NBRC 102515 = DSM 9628]
MLFDRLNMHQQDDAVPNVSRRNFLGASLAAGGGLLISVGLGAVPGAVFGAGKADGAAAFEPNAFVHIGTDGKVTLTMPYIEMGQGTYTAIPMLISEELEIGLQHVRLEHAPPNDKLYANGILGFQVTGGSTTIRGAFGPMRRAGAVARLMLVAAAARRWQVDASSCRAERGEVIHQASGRRLAYGALATDAAGLAMPQADQVALKPGADFKLIGTPAKRLDSPAKVNGTALYGIDARVAGMKIATLAQSPVFGGKLRSVDDSKARAVRGVRQIVKLDDCVAVVADHMGAAKKGLEALLIEWDDGPNGKLNTADIVADMRRASAQPGAVVRSEGDNAKAMQQAATRLDAVYELPFLIHGAMEPLNCTVHVRKDRCEVWVGTQVITRAQAAAAAVTGLPVEKVTVHNHYLGGGFGRRLEVDSITRAVQIAQHVDSPVKIVWSREEDIQHDMYRPYFYDRVSAGLDEQGLPVAWSHRLTGSSILKRWYPPLYNKGFDPETIDGAAHPPYALPNILVDYVNHEPAVPTAFWRGVGPAHNVFVVESFIDELAAAAGQDPVAYRSALLKENPRALAVLQLAAGKAGWGKPMPKGAGRGVSLQFAFGTYLALVAEVAVAPDGTVSVKRVVAAVDAGVIVNPDTVQAQMHSAIIFGISAALYGQATLKDGRIEQSNFHDMRVVRMSETPLLEIHIVSSKEAPGGMGEPGTAALPPALANAIFAATGKRLRKLPIDADLLKSA